MMVSAQCVLNVALTGVIAYLLNIVWNQNYKMYNSSSSNNKCDIQDCEDQTDNLDTVVTSVWCHHGINKMCQFENLCYNSDQDEFVMFRHQDSIIENVEFTDGSLTLDLSSVQGHNTMQTTIISLPSKFSSNFNLTWLQRKSLIFKRFLPDNLMHMFHDDILPLHDSLKYLSFPPNKNRLDSPLTKDRLDAYNIQVIIFNDTEEDVGDDIIDRFYQMFSVYPIKYKKDIHRLNSLTCFTDVTVGVSSRTVWYDYGFKVPQGPLTDTKITSEHIFSSARFITKKLEITRDSQNIQDFIILLTRRENRRILNEGELTLEIVRNTRLKVINLSLDTHSLTDIIQHIRQSKGIIGMHGSLLILSIFLKPDSFVIELFPYAVNPEHYTPYKTLCQIMNVEYMTWTNRVRENSVPHPDWSPEMGGINHLEESEREIIRTQTEVPQHLCCSDPSWLYHIYQDTIVDTSAVISLVQSSIKSLENKKNDIKAYSELINPSKVKGVACHMVPSTIPTQHPVDTYYDLVISFTPPWTLSVTDSVDQVVTYEILIQNTLSEEQSVIRAKTKTNTASVQVKGDGIYVVWIRCVIENVSKGPFSDSVICNKIIS